MRLFAKRNLPFPLIKLAKKLKDNGEGTRIVLNHDPKFPLIKLAKKLKATAVPEGGFGIALLFPLIKLAKKLKE